ncbi:non-specific lipid-transfer protein-like protein At2g13820 [Phalaenopsis equestris]|uniref:non-specific lipid-transfer protein-like protein At2g13820 n=1 Tax=Phalaenopsis equestris TaxID=78828 RepID=UPI0009E3945B|nr:non-specific lipid-transfer protein-like protein At2g13820 [Phalaenopsis equestris]
MDRRTSRAAIAIIIIAISLLSIENSRGEEDCVAAIVSLEPCTDYITGSSPAPTAQCCLKFATVVNTEPVCLCMIVNGGGSQFGIKVNQTRALALPDECKVQTPPVSRCNATAVPSPFVSPPGGGGGNSNGGDSAGSFLKPISLPIVFSIAAVVIACLSMSSKFFLA